MMWRGQTIMHNNLPRYYRDDYRSDAEKMGGERRYFNEPVDPPIQNRKERREGDKNLRAHNRRELGGGKKR
jgi:hypothetical protein